MAEIPITRVVNIQVSEAPAGLAEYEINNLAIFSDETPADLDYDVFAIYENATDVATDWGSSSETYQMAVKIFSQRPNILAGNGKLIIFDNAQLGTSDSDSGILEKVIDGAAQVFFGGFMIAGSTPAGSDATDLADYAESARKLFFLSQHLLTSIESGGLFFTLHAANYDYTRKILYTTSELAARLTMAAYAGLGMSVNFDGSNTTKTMHMKDLVGVSADTGIDNTDLTQCEAVGADCYVNIAGLGKIYSTSGAGVTKFFDQVYNLTWFVFALEVAGFNAIATTSTKLPQTEPGMNQLKNAYIGVLKQAVTNGYLAPGTWNSSDTFGDPEVFDDNIEELGWYIYSSPVSEQSQADRETRAAPLIQIAGKEAGAIHSSDVIVKIEA